MSPRASAKSSPPPVEPQQEARPWRDPGGKLIESGSQTLRQAELLAILIGSGVRGRPAIAIANDILDIYIGLYGIHREATVEDLARIPGLGPRKAARILAAIEFGRRLYRIYHPPKSPPKPEPDLFTYSQPISPPQPAPQAEGPDDAELLAAIIGSGIRGRSPRVIAEDLLARFGGSFRGLFGQDMGDFLPVKGLNSVKIIRIAAALEVAKRVAHAIA